MILVGLALFGILCAAIPAATFLANLPLFRFVDGQDSTRLDDEHVSVLIPARDEEKGIRQSVQAALASQSVNVEVIVLDDHSGDATAEIVTQMSNADPRVRYLAGKTLPAGWNGKQHACRQLADSASHPRLVFLDADVRLEPTALVRLARKHQSDRVGLLSAFPHQQTGTLFEKMIIPLMHFVLLGFLPLRRMRDSTHPAYAAGCGQLFMTDRDDYETSGSHAAICGSRHDGLKLPRVYREAGLSSDVIDGTALAECRMYTNAGEVIRGVLKNAIEGIANPKLIVPFTIILLGGSVLPWCTLAIALSAGNHWAIGLSALAVVLAHLPRAIAAVEFKQSTLGVILHCPSVLLFVSLQWMALANHLLGRQIAWRGRTETAVD